MQTKIAIKDKTHSNELINAKWVIKVSLAVLDMLVKTRVEDNVIHLLLLLHYDNYQIKG